MPTAPLSAAEESLSSRDSALLQSIRRHPGSGYAKLAALLGQPANRATFSRQIGRLKTAGLIRVEGAARATVYFASDPLAHLRTPVRQRKPAGYNFDWIEHFNPLTTPVFGREEKAAMAEAGKISGMRADLFFERTFERFLIDLSYSSSAMEGNTYTLLETGKLIAEGIEARGKRRLDAIMILNHKNAIQYLIEHLADIDISETGIKNIHTLLARGLVEDTAAGQLRSKIVEITKTAYSPLAVPQLIEEQFRLLVRTARNITGPFDQSFFLMTALAYLQPFIDVNKRTGRIACNIPLLQGGLCPLSFRKMDADKYLSGLLIFYETQETSVLKDAYVEGYIQSAGLMQAYATEVLRTPDQIDFIYRKGIDLAVRDIVLQTNAGTAIDPLTIIARMTHGMRPDVRRRVRARVLEILEHLSVDNAVSYGLYAADAAAWQAAKNREAKPPVAAPRKKKTV